jgi:hypothetical protein
MRMSAQSRSTGKERGGEVAKFRLFFLLAEKDGLKRRVCALPTLTSNCGTWTWGTKGLEIPGPPARIDPLAVPLPAGNSFSVAIPLTEFGIDKSGFDRRVTVTARFDGQQLSSRINNPDMAGVAFMPFWAGTVDSNPVIFSAPKKR